MVSDRLNRFVETFDGFKVANDRKVFVAELVRAILGMTGTKDVYAMLMKGNTVTAEAAVRSGGQEFEATDDVRKPVARLLSATKDGSRPIYEIVEGRLVAPFSLTDDIAGAVSIGPGHEEFASEVVAFVRAVGREFALREAAAQLEKKVESIESTVASGGVRAVAYLKPVSELEKDAIELALRTTKWNKEEAARRLGISRASIYMKVKKFGLQKPLD